MAELCRGEQAQKPGPRPRRKKTIPIESRTSVEGKKKDETTGRKRRLPRRTSSNFQGEKKKKDLTRTKGGEGAGRKIGTEINLENHFCISRQTSSPGGKKKKSLLLKSPSRKRKEAAPKAFFA